MTTSIPRTSRWGHNLVSNIPTMSLPFLSPFPLVGTLRRDGSQQFREGIVGTWEGTIVEANTGKTNVQRNVGKWRSYLEPTKMRTNARCSQDYLPTLFNWYKRGFMAKTYHKRKLLKYSNTDNLAASETNTGT